MSKNETESLTIYTDGGARGNPGPAGIGAVLFSGKTKKAEISKYIGHATNNVAEYLAVVYALQEALYIGIKNIVLKVDSQLVARQLRGEYKVRDINIRKFFDIVVSLLSKFENVEIIEIPREKNKEADKLVNDAIDCHVII
ncbi:MAG: ribonuclease HI family protein [Candidatus Omnitrophota bacterium]